MPFSPQDNTDDVEEGGTGYNSGQRWEEILAVKWKGPALQVCKLCTAQST